MRIYLRIGKTTGGFRVEADTRPNTKPLSSRNYTGEKYYPTISFAIEVNLPIDAFSQAERVIAHLNVHPEQLSVNGVDVTL